MPEADDEIEWRAGPALEPGWAPTLAALVAGCCERHGDRPVLIEAGDGWSWPRLERAASALAARWGQSVGPGDRVLIRLPNGAAHLVVELAAWRCGAIAVPLSGDLPTVTQAALERQIAPAVVVDAVPPLRDGGEISPWHRGTAADACLLLATSGSTGIPRLVTLTQGNLCSQQAAFAQLWPEVGPGDRLAAYLPWHHSFGSLAERLWALCRGAALHVVPGAGRDRDALQATIAAVRPTIFMSVPRIHRELRLGAAIDRGALRWAFTAGAPIDAAERAWYAAAEVPLYEGWGLTESSPSACITPPGATLVAGVVGQPIPGVAVGVRRRDGRVLVRGPGVMAGYWRDPVATAGVLADGVLDSGDLGSWEAAGLRIGGRVDQTVKLGNGEKVPVDEIEAALSAAPGVRHAVVAVRNDRLVAALEAADPTVDLGAVVTAVNAAQVVPYLRIAKAWALTRPLDVADGSLTASHKVVRRAVLARMASGDGVARLAAADATAR